MTTATFSFHCPQLSCETLTNGMTKLVIDNQYAHCEIFLQGAHITAYQPKGEAELLWLSDQSEFCEGKAIRGGIPLCWPWFGAHPKDHSKPNHGFARTSLWQLQDAQTLDDGTTEITLQLSETEQTLALWPFKFQLAYQITIADTLKVALTVTNTNSDTMSLSEAIHSYFDVADIEQVSIRGLDEVNYIDKVNGNAENQQMGDISLSGEIDRVFTDTKDTCLLRDKSRDRTLKIAKSGSKDTVVWNPWVEKSAAMDDIASGGYRNFVCIEAANVQTVTVAPSEQHTIAQRVVVI